MDRAKQVSHDLDERSRRPQTDFRKKKPAAPGAIMHVTAPAAAAVSAHLRDSVTSQLQQEQSSVPDDQWAVGGDDSTTPMTTHARRVQNRICRHGMNSVNVTPTTGAIRPSHRDWTLWNPTSGPSKPKEADLTTQLNQNHGVEVEGEVVKFDETFANYWRRVDSKLALGINNAAGKFHPFAPRDFHQRFP